MVLGKWVSVNTITPTFWGLAIILRSCFVFGQTILTLSYIIWLHILIVGYIYNLIIHDIDDIDDVDDIDDIDVCTMNCWPPSMAHQELQEGQAALDAAVQALRQGRARQAAEAGLLKP